MARKASADSAPKKPTRTRRTAANRDTSKPTVTATAEAGGHASIMPWTENQIRERAYFIYLERAGAPGDAVSDWFQAVREVAQVAATTRE